jgi:hypothetical protein
MKTYPEMIAEAEDSIARIDGRIRELQGEAKKLTGQSKINMNQRIIKLEDGRACTAYALQGMRDYLELHPELSEKEEPVLKRDFEWNDLLKDLDSGMTQNDASTKYKVPVSTIQWHVSKRRREAAKAAEAASPEEAAPTVALEPAALETFPPDLKPILNELQRYVSSAARLTLETIEGFSQYVTVTANGKAMFDLGMRCGELHSDIGRADCLVRSILEMFPES